MKLTPKLFIFIIFITVSTTIPAQINSDSLFSQAIQQSKEGKYADAILNCKKILADDPKRIDVINFISNLSAWNKDYKTAKEYIQKGWKIEKTNQDIYATYLNVLLWGGEYEALLKACDNAGTYSYQNSGDLFMKRTLAYKELGRFDDIDKLIGVEKKSEIITEETVEKDGNQEENIDSLLTLSLAYASKKLYPDAMKIAKSARTKAPDRNDVLLMIGNLYAWDGKYDSAKTFINKVLEKDDKNQDAYSSLLNVLLWNKEYDKLFYTANLAEIKGYSDKHNLLLKRTLAYKEKEQYEDALKLLEADEQKPLLDSADIKQLHNDIIWLNKKKAISFFYALDCAKQFHPQHLAFLEWANRMDKYTLALRLNYANRNNTDGVQFETDVYRPLKNKKEYVYLNYGLSFDTLLFPNHRLGFEYYFPFDKNVDASLGARYLLFSKDEVFILTGHIGNSYDNNWIAFRPFFTFRNKGNSFAFIGNYRKYGKSQFDFFGVELGYGNSPDERFLSENINETFKLRSYKIKFERNFLTSKLWEIRFSVGYIYEEFNQNEFRNRYLLETLFRYRL